MKYLTGISRDFLIKFILVLPFNLFQFLLGASCILYNKDNAQSNLVTKIVIIGIFSPALRYILYRSVWQVPRKVSLVCERLGKKSRSPWATYKTAASAFTRFSADADRLRARYYYPPVFIVSTVNPSTRLLKNRDRGTFFCASL